MRQIALLLISVAVVASTVSDAAETTKVDPRVVEDCRKEGQANNLSGAELEKFIASCIAEFQETRLSGSKTLPKGK